MTCAGSGAGTREWWAPSPAGSAGAPISTPGSGKGPECSINFVTCHDGFTLNDLVSYERKHNEANGEDNRDGTDDNLSANYGVEGESDVPAVEALRRRQIKNFLLTLAVSRGVPMLLGGDEFRRTQRGNNNAYCQDNETSWLDWSLRHRHDEILRFARTVLALRRAHPVLRREAFYTDDDIQWFDPRGRRPDWSDSGLAKPGVLDPRPRTGPPSTSCSMPTPSRSPSSCPCRLGRGPGGSRSIPPQPAPRDCHAAGEEGALASQTSYAVGSRASVMLVAR